MKITILCGIPGSGKSTYVGDHLPNALICSADLYPGLYEKLETWPVQVKFHPELLAKAHAACLKGFVEVVTDPREADIMRVTSVVVDNTNTTIAEIAPYAALALAYDHDLEIVTLQCDPEIGAQRNSHGVPVKACYAMAMRLDAREIPPWWNHRVIG